ncbi:hypothetical protein [Paenarthrobacter nitroguajacolicus]|uniref:hypothetical protein n=1 Tax=Paenarthrobacter nitroguajacolicus TaxID=211146 RepID=UPI00248C66CB|nr:hypothetical protein [Paenarthrobacter nitroguajacolicus]MDI2036382.1 hypothetical protein [Paenarthrobacter nitroguajacolicus]
MAREPEPSLEQLNILVGEWQTTIPSAETRGRTTFEWLEGGGFLIQRSTVERPEYPNAVSIIGATGSDGAFQQHYFDSRGVTRIFDMMLRDNVWTLFRDGPDWPQRFVGHISGDGNTINARLERGNYPGGPLEHDFDMVYSRIA